MSDEDLEEIVRRGSCVEHDASCDPVCLRTLVWKLARKAAFRGVQYAMAKVLIAKMEQEAKEEEADDE